MQLRLSLSAPLALLLIPATALAQGAPEGIAGQAPASSGATNVAEEGFQTSEKPASAPSADSTNLLISAGGMLSTGNARNLALTGSGNFQLRRDAHQFTTALAANYGRAAVAPDEPVETTVENYQGKLRYDWFMTKAVAGFLQVSGRRDRFQGLDLRLNVDPGIAYYFIDQDTQHLWGELGYDLQHDIRRDASLLTPDGTVLDKTATRHNARAFLGYDNKVNAAVSLYTGLEYLQALSPFEDPVSSNVNWRLNWDAGITSRVADALSIATTFTLKYDNNPLPGLSELDTVTSLSLVYEVQ